MKRRMWSGRVMGMESERREGLGCDGMVVRWG